MSAPYYVTTAISYPNGPPHLGHAYEAIAADVIARHKRARGFRVRFQTGTDEHGLKMAQKARELGMTPRALADEMSSHFITMCDDLDISYDRFIRTSEPAHHLACQALWKRIEEAGDLYQDQYEGWYSVRDEAFYAEDELVTAPDGTRLSPQGTPVDWTREDSWFFRLSRYQQPLIDHYAANPDFIRPASRRNEIVRFVEGGLRDLSVSRRTLDWGVAVPGDDDHVMYVWLDALTNYLSGLGYPDMPADLADQWPCDLHLVGKDITRFHAVYWPAFLMSAGIALPKSVYAHGFLLVDGEKMSKSQGNVLGPETLRELLGSDAMRYVLMRDVSFGQDGSISPDAMVQTANADLANSFGNLVQRSLSMIFKNLSGELPKPGNLAEDMALLRSVEDAVGQCGDRFDALEFSFGIEAWLRGVFDCNAYVDAAAPWALRKSDPARMAAVLGTLVEAIRLLAGAIAPVTPRAAAAVLEATSAVVQDDGIARIAQPRPVFPRIDAGLAEVA